MIRFLTVSALGALALTGAACAPVIGSHGYQVIEAAPADVAVGTDTKTTVRDRLGTPSATSLFEGDDIWYYISQTTEKYTFNLPQVSQRAVTEIVFEGEQVASVRVLGLDDGRQVAMNRNETPTRGRELTILEQLLGNVGRGQLPRTDEDAPGQRRPD
ncbi:outer membrane protein assembly factor BamE [Brevundimonas sp.]|jgi:outer membrane protein assembly factor BamE (lipoprotein component of BamABCDE complex)|uniref:outer membrane protein assembly factor BamE n=1 Tax=Brevundimonas sp. TaxID=1871086 RepID=UPI002E121C8A|nr:outer membrane protein assembly factor BamE [Brevundimonas sp.]